MADFSDSSVTEILGEFGIRAIRVLRDHLTHDSEVMVQGLTVAEFSRTLKSIRCLLHSFPQLIQSADCW